MADTAEGGVLCHLCGGAAAPRADDRAPVCDGCRRRLLSAATQPESTPRYEFIGGDAGHMTEALRPEAVIDALRRAAVQGIISAFDLATSLGIGVPMDPDGREWAGPGLRVPNPVASEVHRRPEVAGLRAEMRAQREDGRSSGLTERVETLVLYWCSRLIDARFKLVGQRLRDLTIRFADAADAGPVMAGAMAKVAVRELVDISDALDPPGEPSSTEPAGERCPECGTGREPGTANAEGRMDGPCLLCGRLPVARPAAGMPPDNRSLRVQVTALCTVCGRVHDVTVACPPPPGGIWSRGG